MWPTVLIALDGAGGPVMAAPEASQGQDVHRRGAGRVSFVSWDFDMRRLPPRPIDREFSLDFDIGQSFDGTVS
jgi:hypothetical protein